MFVTDVAAHADGGLLLAGYDTVSEQAVVIAFSKSGVAQWSHRTVPGGGTWINRVMTSPGSNAAVAVGWREHAPGASEMVVRTLDGEDGSLIEDYVLAGARDRWNAIYDLAFDDEAGFVAVGAKTAEDYDEPGVWFGRLDADGLLVSEEILRDAPDAWEWGKVVEADDRDVFLVLGEHFEEHAMLASTRAFMGRTELWEVGHSSATSRHRARDVTILHDGTILALYIAEELDETFQYSLVQALSPEGFELWSQRYSDEIKVIRKLGDDGSWVAASEAGGRGLVRVSVGNGDEVWRDHIGTIGETSFSPAGVAVRDDAILVAGHVWDANGPKDSLVVEYSRL